MTGLAYYNEWEPYAAQWLRNLITAGHLTAGDVDDRDIREVDPDALRPYTRVHLFAGIGGWDYALGLADWPADFPVWTVSCPCQPFSGAGKTEALGDERHLWPAVHRLLAECRPAIVVGEQVASRLGREWLAGVRTDLEGLGYAVGAADLCAAGVGAPHIRQRLWWVAESQCHATEPGRVANESRERARTASTRPHAESGRRSSAGGLADAQSGIGRLPVSGWGPQQDRPESEWCGEDGRLEQPKGNGRITRRAESGGRSFAERRSESGVGDSDGNGAQRTRAEQCEPDAAGKEGGMGDTDSECKGSTSNEAGTRNPWGTSLDNWLPCADGKARRIEPGLEPLAHGVPARVGKLRAYGNAIVPQLAATFLKAYLAGISHPA